MNRYKLVTRSIRYYAKFLILITLGVTIATAVITGALLAGNSVPKSIEKIAVERLGSIELALSSPQLFTTGLVNKIRKDTSSKNTAGVLSLAGFLKHPKEDITVPKINILGIDSYFAPFYNSNISLQKREVAINDALAQDLQAKEGDSLIVYIYRESLSPKNTLFARKKMEDNVYTLRVQISKIIANEGMGSFRLDANPEIPRNIFIDQEWLAESIKKKDFVNTILTSHQDELYLQKYLSFADLGLYITSSNRNHFFLQSKHFVFREDILSNILKTTQNLNIPTQLSSVYLLQNIHELKNQENSAYAIVSGLSSVDIEENSVYLNEWLATNLDSKIKDEVEVEYEISENGILRNTKRKWNVADIISMDNNLVSADFIPEFEGLTNADTIQSWDVPFTIDLSLISSEDEEYWEKYKATPKIFVSVATMKELWGNNEKTNNGWVTSIVIDKLPHLSVESLEKEIVAKITPASYGFVFRPIRQMAIHSAQGSTDFSGLFIGMNFFVLLSAILLIVMLTKLYTTSRASQIGIMRAHGFSHGEAVRPIVQEGILYCTVGSILGGFLGILYAKCIIFMLTTSWVEAVGTSQLQLFISVQSLLSAISLGFVTGLFAIYWGTKSLRKYNILLLLKGWKSLENVRCAEVKNHFRYCYILLIAALLFYFAAQANFISATIAFFFCGTLFMLSCYFGLSSLLSAQSGNKQQLNYYFLIRKNLTLYRERYLLIFVLFCFASFILIAVAINRNDFSQIDTTQKDSGTGGFSLQLVTSFPFHYDLTSPSGRKELGFSQEDEKYFSESEIHSFWFFKGEDISCLNLAKAKTPNIIGVSSTFIFRGGFSTTPANPWEWLETTNTNFIPAIADANSVMWSLNSGLNKNFEIDVPGGQASLKFVGLLHNSILASEIIISEENFHQLFPDISSPSYYLISCPKTISKDLKRILQKVLGNHGVIVKETPELLNNFIQVQNTYITTFMTLGGLGMFLGVFGLIVVVIYSLMQRQSEFALLKCIGMPLKNICHIVFTEVSFISSLGLLCGTLSATIAVFPRIISSQTQIQWDYIVVILLGMLLLSVLISYITTKYISRFDLLKSLRQE